MSGSDAAGATALHHARPVLVTGGAGFIGCNLVDRLASAGHDVLVFDALARPGVEANLAWLRRRHPGRIHAVIADLRDRAALEQAIRNNRPCLIDVHVDAEVRPPSTGTWQLPPTPFKEPAFGKPWVPGS